ncbi:hypothetical protein B0T12DRAFT_219536 [Alternaria alternata]|nr:hypothetical protein B0T12DRAFT_219536 [Alternaria alternata]
MACDETMLSDFAQNDPINDFGGPCFYHVFSEISATTYHSRSTTGSRLLQADCEFTFSHLSPECIEQHLWLRDTQPSPFISVFSDFAEALQEAYDLHVRGHEAIQVVQIQASDLVTTLVGASGIHCALVPLWHGRRGGEDQWLCMADIGPLLDIDPRCIRPSEWLACGSIPRSRYSAAWPIIGGRIYFDEGSDKDLVDLFMDVCGYAPDRFREHNDFQRYEYDWDEECFVGTESWRMSSASIQETGVAGAGLGLGLAVSQFARPTPFGYAGYLRGMVVMD